MDTKKKTKFFSGEYFLYDFAKVTAALPGLIVFRPKIYYKSPAAKKHIKGGAILIGNHESFLDPISMQFCIWYRRHHFICAKELFASKGRFFLSHFMCIPIDRENFGMDFFHQIADRLKRGEVISMFPEGTLKDGIQTFKSGMVLMAMQGNAPIVPIYIKRRKSYWNRLVMAVGEPVDVAGICGNKPAFSQIEKVTELVHDQEVQLKELCDRKENK